MNNYTYMHQYVNVPCVSILQLVMSYNNLNPGWQPKTWSWIIGAYCLGEDQCIESEVSYPNPQRKLMLFCAKIAKT